MVNLLKLGVAVFGSFVLFVTVLYALADFNFALIAGIIPIGIWAMFFRQEYPLNFEIRQPRSNGTYKKIRDSGAVKKLPNGEFILELRRLKLKTKPFDYKTISYDERGREIIEAVMIDQDTLIPLEMAGEDMKRLTPIDHEIEAWRATEIEKANLRYKKDKGLDKYLQYIGLFIIIIGAAIMFFVIGGQVDKISEKQAAITSAQYDITVRQDQMLQMQIMSLRAQGIIVQNVTLPFTVQTTNSQIPLQTGG